MAKLLSAAAYVVLTVLWPARRSRRTIGSCGVALRGASELLTSAVLALLAACALLAQPWKAPDWLTICGWTAIAVGTILTCAAQAQMGKSWRVGIDAHKTQLVTAGLYRHIRNPIFTGLQLTVIGLALVLPSVWSLMLLVLSIALLGRQVRAEERHLTAMHGAEYIRWASSAGRFVPGIGRFK